MKAEFKLKLWILKNQLVFRVAGLESRQRLRHSNKGRMVANQCIFEGGPAVISARVFLNSQYPFLHFDDAYFCNSGSNRFADQNNNDYKTGFIKCYPNPASNNLLVEFKVETESVLYVFDNIGRQVISLSIDKNNHFINLDVSKLSNGHYLLRIANLNCSLTGKFNIKK